MNDFMSAFAGSAVGAGAAAAAIWGIFRYVLTKRIDQHFERLNALAETQVELQRKAAETHIDQELAIYPALSQLVYQAKLGANLARDATTCFQIASPELVSACRDLTTQLVKFRLYLSPELFKLVHEYKHSIQDIIVMADVLTRPRSQDDLSIPENAKHKLDHLISRIDKQCEEIVTALQFRMTRLRGPLNTADESA